MPAIVIGTYVCALVGARESPPSDKTILPRPAFRAAAPRPTPWATTRPFTAATPLTMAALDPNGR